MNKPPIWEWFIPAINRHFPQCRVTLGNFFGGLPPILTTAQGALEEMLVEVDVELGKSSKNGGNGD